MQNDILDVTQAAAYLKMSTRTLQRLGAKATGPLRIHLSSARVIYLRANLDAWLAGCAPGVAAPSVAA